MNLAYNVFLSLDGDVQIFSYFALHGFDVSFITIDTLAVYSRKPVVMLFSADFFLSAYLHITPRIVIFEYRQVLLVRSSNLVISLTVV